MAEFLFELFFELFIEVTSSFYACAYIRLARAFDPKKAITITPKVEKRIKIIVTIITVILFFAMVIGTYILSDGEMYTLGMCLTFIPLTVLILQVVLSIAVIISKGKKHRKK